MNRIYDEQSISSSSMLEKKTFHRHTSKIRSNDSKFGCKIVCNVVPHAARYDHCKRRTHTRSSWKKDCLQMSLRIAVEQQNGRAAPSLSTVNHNTIVYLDVVSGELCERHGGRHEDLEVGAERQ
jgi:hypothetical protein